MKLREFLDHYRIHPLEFALRCEISPASIYAYLSGRTIPRQKIAEKIESVTQGHVTVKELRGEDERYRR